MREDEKGDKAHSDDKESIPTISGDGSVTEPSNSSMGQVDGQIGSYKLLKVLGEGGYGIVYLAEQQKPIKRQVAIKVIKPGMDSKQVIARFEAERQTLALLDHPNIAHVFDAGTTKAGRLYFVMEYVNGVSLTNHCDQEKLSIEQRLELFLQVCEAVHYAHQKGIIHRDIKPSNILVSIEADKALPKIIDFGVAKALTQPLAERTFFTEQGQLIGTPEYMSPEQAEMANEDIDTRSDIYSLGILLYVLLTGSLPFDRKSLQNAAFAEILRIIREEDPPTPSTRLSSIGEDAEKVAESRSTQAITLVKRLQKELEWIPLKAMRKERSHRYQSASDLASDIRNYLSGAPLIAGPESTMYRLKKFIRRHQALLAGVAAVLVVLAAGVIVSIIFAIGERQEREKAVRATQAEREQSRLREIAEAASEKEAGLRQQAQARELAMRQLAYAYYTSDMSLAQQALAMNDLGRARRLLEGHQPGPGGVDLRGWEWRYLWQECRSDALGELYRYPNSACAVAYSPNGRVLAVTGLIQGFVEIWDVPGRKRIATLQPKEGNLVAFSPHGDLLATNAGKQIRLWRTDTWGLVDQLTPPDDVKDLKFSPDGKRLACMSSSNEVILWEVDQDQWKIVRRIRGVRLQGYWGALDFSPDGKALAIGDYTHRLQVVDLASGNMDVNIPEAHSEGITSVAWSPNGSIIASGSGFSGGQIRLWDAASGKPLGELKGHTSWICELIFSTDGLRLYSAGGDQTIRIWDVGQQRCLATLRGSSHEVYGLALSPDGTTLASACKDGVVAFWDVRHRPEEEQPRLIALGRFAWPAFAPDSRVLAVPRAGTVSLFNLVTSKEIEQLPALGTGDVRMVAYSPDGTLLVSGSNNGKIRVWSCTERRLLRELDDHKKPIFGLYFRADGTRLLSVDIKGNAIWWDALTWQAGKTFEVEFVGGGAVSPDGRLLAISVEGGMQWFNAETGEFLATTAGPPHSMARVAFSGDGSQVAGVSEYGTVALWDPSSFQWITAFQGHMQGAQGVAFSPDGRRLATGGGTDRDAVKLWDLSTHRELVTLSGQGSLFLIVVFSPDGKWLAACSYEGTIHLWRAPSWAEIEAAEKRLPTGQPR